MVKIPTLKMALLGAGLIMLGQPTEAAFRKMSSLTKNFLKDLHFAFHTGKKEWHKHKAESHEWQVRRTQENFESYLENHFSRACLRKGLMFSGIGLAGYGATKALSPEKLSDYSNKAAKGTFALGGGLMYIGAIMNFPISISGPIFCGVPAILGAIRYGKAKRAQKQAKTNAGSTAQVGQDIANA